MLFLQEAGVMLLHDNGRPVNRVSRISFFRLIVIEHVWNIISQRLIRSISSPLITLRRLRGVEMRTE